MRYVHTKKITPSTHAEFTNLLIPLAFIFTFTYTFTFRIGFGNDSHGQSATKAAGKFVVLAAPRRPKPCTHTLYTYICIHKYIYHSVRACRNAIEFNSIPSIQKLVPGGYDALKLHVILAVPPQYQSTLDLDPVRAVFPYYKTLDIDIQNGGMVAPSGIAIDALGDVNDDMVIVCAAVTVGY